MEMEKELVRIESLPVFPIKSCGGIMLQEARLTATGLAMDRRWILHTLDGEMVTQRKEYGRILALVKPELLEQALRLQAPQQSELIIPLEKKWEGVSERQISVWGNNCLGVDEGDAAAQWFSRYLQKEVRLARISSNHDRVVSPEWVGHENSRAAFQDGFPLLIASAESLKQLNLWLAEAGGKPVTVEDFRANINISGLPAFAEHDLARISLPARNIQIEVVKPCARCVMVDVDQRTGDLLSEKKEQRPLYQLVQNHSLSLRADKPKPVFAENAYVSSGEGQVLRVGDVLEVTRKGAPL